MIIFDLFCLNTDSEMSIIDRAYFCKLISNYKSRIKTIDTSTKVRNIETSVVIFNESIKINMNIFDLLNEKSVTTRILEIFHIVKELSVKILIEMNIIDSERMIINSNKVIIENCQNMSIDLFATNSTNSRIKRIVTSIKEITLFSHTNQFVSATIREKFKKFFNRNYVFHSTNDNRLSFDDDILFHIVNVNFFCVNIKNATNSFVVISRRSRLRVLQEYENDDCYLASSENAHLTTDK